MLARYGEVPLTVIHLDVAILTPASRQFTLNKNVNALSRRRNLGVRVRSVDDVFRPRLNLTRLRIAAAVKIDSHKPVRLAENKSYPGKAAIAVRARRHRFIKCGPGFRIVTIGKFSGRGRVGRFRDLPVASCLLPADPLFERLKCPGNVGQLRRQQEATSRRALATRA